MMSDRYNHRGVFAVAPGLALSVIPRNVSRRLCSSPHGILRRKVRPPPVV